MDFTRTALGIEFGSTRIKAVLIDEKNIPIASGDYEWENQLKDGIWTYSMDKIHEGLQTCFAALKADVKETFAEELTTVGAIGISGMMHGYLPFDKEGNRLRTSSGSLVISSIRIKITQPTRSVFSMTL